MATILIVDDNPANRRLMMSLLEHQAHRLLEAADGSDVLQMVRTERPDLIIADVLMPVMDGHEMLKAIRQDQDACGIPVVFFTAHYGARTLALAGGAAWFLTNAEASELAGVVQRVLAGETEAQQHA